MVFSQMVRPQASLMPLTLTPPTCRRAFLPLHLCFAFGTRGLLQLYLQQYVRIAQSRSTRTQWSCLSWAAFQALVLRLVLLSTVTVESSSRIVFIQVLHGACFACFWIAAVDCANTAAPQGMEGTARASPTRYLQRVLASVRFLSYIYRVSWRPSGVHLWRIGCCRECSCIR